MKRTRHDKAQELRRLLTDGPHWSFMLGGQGRQGQPVRDEATAAFKVWSESWVLPLLDDLVPELRAPKAAPAAEAKR